MIALWTEIGECVARAGIRKLLLFNGHGGQVSVMDIVARELRTRWGTRMAELVRPGGTLLCMVFPIITPPPGYQGPPWPLTVDEVRGLLADHFDVLSETPSLHTHPGREGKECLLELVRRS